MNVYAESSAVLAWLLAERECSRISPLLTGAEMVVSSDLTLIECDRTLFRASLFARISEMELNDRRRELADATSRWSVLRISPDIVERARRPFPVEPIRSLDAIHLASALSARSSLPTLEILSLDDRMRNAARQLGFKLQPR